MFLAAEFEDNFFVSKEWKNKPHLIPFARQDTRVVRDILKNGITSKYALHPEILSLPKFKREEKFELERMILAKENHFLVLPGETDCVDNAKEWREWDQIYDRKNQENVGRHASPIYIDQDSPLLPTTPANSFPFPEGQTISVEKKVVSPSEVDHEIEDRKKFVQSLRDHDWKSGVHPLLPGPVRYSPVLFCSECFRDLDLEDCTCPPHE